MFCICLDPLSHSRRVAHRSASSCFHLWPRPTLNLMSERSKRRKNRRKVRIEKEEEDEKRKQRIEKKILTKKKKREKEKCAAIIL